MSARYYSDPDASWLRTAVTLYCRFEDDPEFWRLVETMKSRRRKGAA